MEKIVPQSWKDLCCRSHNMYQIFKSPFLIVNPVGGGPQQECSCISREQKTWYHYTLWLCLWKCHNICNNFTFTFQWRELICFHSYPYITWVDPWSQASHARWHKICNVSRICTIDERSWLKFRMFTWLNFQVWTQNCSTASVRLVACQSSAVPRLSTKIKTAPVPNHMCTKKCSSQQYPQPKKTNSNFCAAKKGWWLMICIKNLSPCEKVCFCWEKKMLQNTTTSFCE